MGNKVPRKQLDWEGIEREYRAGQLSIREIASQHGCSDAAIRKRMKRDGIERDLSKRVAEKVRTRLVRAELRTSDPLTEKETVEEAAARVVEVVRSHRVKIGKGIGIVDILFDQLADVAAAREEIEADIEAETEEDRSPKRRSRMLRAIGLQANASTVLNLSNALKNLVSLERQAFNVEAAIDGDEAQVLATDIPLYMADMIKVAADRAVKGTGGSDE